jgi:hypothetical protein
MRAWSMILTASFAHHICIVFVFVTKYEMLFNILAIVLRYYYNGVENDCVRDADETLVLPDMCHHAHDTCCRLHAGGAE